MSNVIKQFSELRQINQLNLDMTWDDLHDPALLKDGVAFAKAAIKSIQNDEHILVFGDYDTDGSLATVVMLRGLRELNKYLGCNAKISYFINDRFKDGYGISAAAIDKVLMRNPKLDTIITVDNGIVAMDAVQYAKMKGLKVLVTDHHQSLDELPAADVVVDPNQPDDEYPFKGISGTTVAWKLLKLIAQRFYPEFEIEVDKLVDFVGVSVVSDIMPMLDENRVFVKRALDILNGKDAIFRPRFGWYAIKEVLIRNKKLQRDHQLDEKDFGFLFSPVINAQSRVNGKANITVDLFTSQSTDDVREKADYMVSVNEDRKSISNEAFNRINQTDFSGRSVIIVRDDNLGEGLIGLVAGKLTERYNRPSIVFCLSDNGLLKGSARGIENYDLIAELRKVDDLCESLGGHPGAAGLAIKEANYDQYVERITALFDQLIPADLTSDVTPEITVAGDEVSVPDIEALQQFAPFGESFAYPIFKVTNLMVTSVKEIGKDKNHLKLTTDEGIDILLWNVSEETGDFLANAADHRIDVVGRLEINSWRGKSKLQLIVANETVTIND